MKKIKIAIDGCGDLCARTILPHLQQHDAQQLFEVVALCDVVPQRAQEMAQRFQAGAAFLSLDEMLSSCDAAAVLVVVPAHLHGEHALQCLRAGRHVYVQKPLAASLQEANALLDASIEYSLRVVAAPFQAHWPLFSQLREAIGRGEIGVPFHALGSFIGWGGFDIHHGSDPSWCFVQGSGPLRDHGVYGLQSLTSMLGSVARVAALARIQVSERRWQGQTFPVTEADCVSLLLDFANGTHATLNESWCAAFEPATAFRIQGLEGTIEGLPEYAGYHGIFPLACRIHRGGKTREIRIDPDTISFLQGEHAKLENPHIYGDIWHLSQCIRGEVDNVNASLQHARHTVDILETAHRAAQSGQTLSLHSSVD